MVVVVVVLHFAYGIDIDIGLSFIRFYHLPLQCSSEARSTATDALRFFETYDFLLFCKMN